MSLLLQDTRVDAYDVTITDTMWDRHIDKKSLVSDNNKFNSTAHTVLATQGTGSCG
jgi:hypothetical protein